MPSICGALTSAFAAIAGFGLLVASIGVGALVQQLRADAPAHHDGLVGALHHELQLPATGHPPLAPTRLTSRREALRRPSMGERSRPDAFGKGAFDRAMRGVAALAEPACRLQFNTCLGTGDGVAVR